jgi:crossover junction endodeoxyribonuclease RuvC
MYKYATSIIIIHLIRRARQFYMIIMGIDPGFAITGYGVVKYEGNKFSVIDYGAITTEAKMLLSKRLLVLSNSLDELLDKYKPDAFAIEELFFNKNIKTALTVGHGRGVAILSAAKAGVRPRRARSQVMAAPLEMPRGMRW